MGIRSWLFISSLVLLNCSCSGSGNSNHQLISQLTASRYKVAIWVDSTLRKDSVRLISEYGLEELDADYLWKKNIGREPIIGVSNASGFGYQFPISKWKEHESILSRLTADFDTVSREQTFDRDGRYCFDESIFVASSANTMYRVDRYNGQVTTFQLSDSLVRSCLYSRYHSDSMYDLTQYMIRKKGVLDERVFYYPQMYKDTLIVQCTMTSCDVNPKLKTDTGIKKTQYLLKYKNDQLVAINPLPFGYFQGNYYLEVNNYEYTPQRVTFYVRQYPLTDTNMHVFAQFVPDDQGQLVFRNFLPSKFPEEYFRHNLLYVPGDVAFQYPYYIFPASDKVYNLYTGKYTLANSLYQGAVKDGISGFYVLMERSVCDFKIDCAGIYHFSILDEGYFQIVTFDPACHSIINRTKLWPTKCGKSVPYFDKWDYNYVFYWEKNYLIRRRV